MKKLLLSLGVALVLVVAFACTQGGGSTPTAPEAADLTAVTDEAKNPVLVCHYNPDQDDYLPLWHIVEVSGRAYSTHCSHGDFSQSGAGDCNVCNLSYYGAEVGDDCGYCAPLS